MSITNKLRRGRRRAAQAYADSVNPSEVREGAVTRGPVLLPAIQAAFWPDGRVLPRPKLDVRGHLPIAYSRARHQYMVTAHKAGWSCRAIAATLGVSRQLVEQHLSSRQDS